MGPSRGPRKNTSGHLGRPEGGSGLVSAPPSNPGSLIGPPLGSQGDRSVRPGGSRGGHLGLPGFFVGPRRDFWDPQGGQIERKKRNDCFSLFWGVPWAPFGVPFWSILVIFGYLFDGFSIISIIPNEF